MFTDFWARVVTRIERAAADEPYVLDLTGCVPLVTRADTTTPESMQLGKDELSYDRRMYRERDGVQP